MKVADLINFTYSQATSEGLQTRVLYGAVIASTTDGFGELLMSDTITGDRKQTEKAAASFMRLPGYSVARIVKITCIETPEKEIVAVEPPAVEPAQEPVMAEGDYLGGSL